MRRFAKSLDEGVACCRCLLPQCIVYVSIHVRSWLFFISSFHRTEEHTTNLIWRWTEYVWRPLHHVPMTKMVRLLPSVLFAWIILWIGWNIRPPFRSDAQTHIRQRKTSSRDRERTRDCCPAIRDMSTAGSPYTNTGESTAGLAHG